MVEWGPSEGVIDRDPFVLDDVRFGPGLGLKEEVEEIEEEEDEFGNNRDLEEAEDDLDVDDAF